MEELPGLEVHGSLQVYTALTWQLRSYPMRNPNFLVPAVPKGFIKVLGDTPDPETSR